MPSGHGSGCRSFAFAVNVPGGAELQTLESYEDTYVPGGHNVVACAGTALLKSPNVSANENETRNIRLKNFKIYPNALRLHCVT